MPINKEMVLKDAMNHEIPVEYHVIKTMIVNTEEDITRVIIASYHAKGQKEWQVDSYVKPPMTLTIEGIDKSVMDVQNYLLTLPEWEGATIEA
jgi:hypothetical protein